MSCITAIRPPECNEAAKREKLPWTLPAVLARPGLKALRERAGYGISIYPFRAGWK